MKLTIPELSLVVHNKSIELDPRQLLRSRGSGQSEKVKIDIDHAYYFSESNHYQLCLFIYFLKVQITK